MWKLFALFLVVSAIRVSAYSASDNNTQDLPNTKEVNCPQACVPTELCPSILEMMQNASVTQDFEKIAEEFVCNDSDTVCCPEMNNNSSQEYLVANYFECCTPKGLYAYGGEYTEENEFASLALLEYEGPNGKSNFECGSSLINNFYVLTAAHCVTDNIVKRFGILKNVRLGDNELSALQCEQPNCKSNIEIIPVGKIIPHENFIDNDLNRHYDIALIELSKPVQYSESIRPICMPWIFPYFQPDKNDTYTIVGWGRTLSTKKSVFSVKVEIPSYDHDECARKYARRRVNITNSQICAGGEFKKDACDGDSGGPLTVIGDTCIVQSGIVSFGRGCGLENWPGIYTNVHFYKDWILSKIEKFVGDE